MFWTLMNSPRMVFAPEDGTGTGDAGAGNAAVPAADGGSSVLTGDPAGDNPPADAGDQGQTGGDQGQSEGGDQNDDQGDDPLDTVPEDGTYALTMPEGVEVDQQLLDALSPDFKEMGLTTKQAQTLADKFIAAQQAKAEAQAGQFAETVAGWADQAKKDPEIGGAKWDGTVKNATTIVSRFGSPALKEFLNSSGAGNHPEMIRFMAKVGAVIGEDNPAISENPGRMQAKDTASILYPDDKPKG